MANRGWAATGAVLSRYSTPPQALAVTTMASRTGRRMRVILSFDVGRDCAAAAPKRHAPERSAVAGAASAASSSGTHRDQKLAAEAAPTKHHTVDGVAPLPWAPRRSGPSPSARPRHGSPGPRRA